MYVNSGQINVRLNGEPLEYVDCFKVPGGDVINANVLVIRKGVEPEMTSVTIVANQLTTSHVPDEQHSQTATSHILL